MLIEGYRIEVLRTRSEFEELRHEWECLDRSTHYRNPFLSYRWTQACLDNLPSCRSPFFLTARAGVRLVGVAPLRREGRLGLRVLRFAGDGRSDYLGFLCSPDHPQVERILLEGLAVHRAEWDLAVLRQLAVPFSTLSSVPLPRPLRDRSVAGTIAPYLAHDGDWASLVEAGPYWLREMKKSNRRFEREGGTVECFTGTAAADRMGQVAWVEAHSWKGRQETTRLQRGPGADLIRQALATMGDAGMELWLARLNDTPVAYQIAFRSVERIALYSSAYHEDHRRYSPGALVIYHAVRAAWTAGVREYDFMSGDEEYKRERTDSVRPIEYRAFFPPTARGLLAYGLVVAPRWHLKQHATGRRLHEWLLRSRSAAVRFVGTLRTHATTRPDRGATARVPPPPSAGGNP
jgi:CelD/BcsL family acetyltransferase involved in cellulose biosynthesis